MRSELITPDDWDAWLHNAADDDLRDLACKWAGTRTGQEAQMEIERREAGSDAH